MRFAIPIGLGKMFQLCYNLADTCIIESCLGEVALASIGLTNSLDSLLVGFLTGMADGFAIIVARRFGSKEEDRSRNAVALTIVLGILTSVLLTCFGTVFLRDILIALNTPVELLQDAQNYFQIILIGLTASVLYNVASAVLRSIGDTVTPLCFLIGSTVINVLLDLLLICEFHAGVRGAAFATVISQLLSSIACVVYAWVRYPLLRLREQDFHFRIKNSERDVSIRVFYGIYVVFG